MEEQLISGEERAISEGNESSAEYFVISVRKLWKLYVLTFGIYALYWFYINWKLQKPFMKESIMPVPRAIFYVFYTHSLFDRISDSLASKKIQYKFNAGIMATAFIVLVLLGNFAGQLADMSEFPAYISIVWLVTFLLSVYPLEEAQDAVNILSDDPLGLGNSKYSRGNIIAMVIGGVLWALVLLGVVAVILEK